MEPKHLTDLAEALASHRGRSRMTIARWAGVHSRLFDRLMKGQGCRIDTYATVIRWFAENWPADLEWPRHIPRPPKQKKEAA